MGFMIISRSRMIVVYRKDGVKFFGPILLFIKNPSFVFSLLFK
jgi:hypothetical protein